MELTKQQLTALRTEQTLQKGKKPYVRVTAVLMLAQGLSAEQVADFLGISPTTVRNAAKRYADKGLKGILKDNHVAYQGKLTADQCRQLKRHLIDHLYLTTAPIQAYIVEHFGIVLTASGVAKLLGRLGFVYKRTRLRPGGASQEAQREFLRRHADLLSESGPPEDTHVYFNDGVHPTYNTRPDYGWILKGDEYEIDSTGSRKRVNLHGAINAHDPTQAIINPFDRINSQAVIATWEEQLRQHPTGLIYNICDNAKYYHSRLIKEWLADHPRVQVIYLPSYSPNLNLIERLWRLLRRQVINTIYHATYDKFRAAILDFVGDLSAVATQLGSLLTLRFRVVTK